MQNGGFVRTVATISLLSGGPKRELEVATSKEMGYSVGDIVAAGVL
jgi:hypothetical protein